MSKAKENPFALSMCTLYVPAHMGRSLNVGGFEITAEEDGAVEVPKQHVQELLAHGLTTEAPAPAAPTIGSVQGRK